MAVIPGLRKPWRSFASLQVSLEPGIHVFQDFSIIQKLKGHRIHGSRVLRFCNAFLSKRLTKSKPRDDFLGKGNGFRIWLHYSSAAPLFNIIIRRFCGFHPICVKSLLFNVIIQGFCGFQGTIFVLFKHSQVLSISSISFRVMVWEGDTGMIQKRKRILGKGGIVKIHQM